MEPLLQFLSWATRRESDEGLTPSITNMKAQKLAYLAESLYGHLENRDLSAGVFQAWDHGPAQPDLYRFIKSRVGDSPAAPLEPFSAGTAILHDFEEIFDGIWENFGEMTATQLRNFTHTYGPYDHHYRVGVRDITILKNEIHNAWPDFINGLHISERSPEMRRRVDALKTLPPHIEPHSTDSLNRELIHNIFAGHATEP